MKLLLGILILVTFISTNLSAMETTKSAQAELDITYIGNEGFLIQSKNRKVLIDALFRSRSASYLSPSEEMIEQMIQGKSPYDKVDLLLVTHCHSDHFNPELAVAFLENNPSCKLIGNNQVAEELRNQTGFEKVKSQIIEVDSDVGNHSTFIENGIEIDAFSQTHSPYMRGGKNIHAEIKNSAFIVNLEGSRFYHSGDATIKGNLEGLKNYKFSQKTVDIMFLQRYDVSPTTKEFVIKTIKPDMIIAIHIGPEKLDDSIKRFMTHYPYGIIFREQGESMHFTNSVNFHELSGPYLGQQPPGAQPEVFAPGIISTPNSEHSAPSFSPDGKKIIWSMWRIMPGIQTTDLDQVIMFTEEKDGQWTYPDFISFSGKDRDGGPQFSADGQVIFYNSRRTVQTDTGEVKKWKRFYSQLRENGWSEGKEILEIPEGQLYKNIYHMYGQTPIVKIEDEFYRLPDINLDFEETKEYYCSFYFSKDDNMVVFSSNIVGNGDLFVSHKNSDESWKEPKHLENPINTNRQERFAGFSPDEKYLFFTRHRGGDDHDIWWVKAESIGILKK